MSFPNYLPISSSGVAFPAPTSFVSDPTFNFNRDFKLHLNTRVSMQFPLTQTLDLVSLVLAVPTPRARRRHDVARSIKSYRFASDTTLIIRQYHTLIRDQPAY